MSTLKVGTIQDHSNSNTGIELHSTGSIKTLKRPQVHLASTKSDGTYAVTGNDFSIGGSLGLMSGTSAIDCSFDVNGKMTVTHAGLYMAYAYIYLYQNATSGVASLAAYKGTTGSAPYSTGGTQFANIDVFEWNGVSGGRMDNGLGGQAPVVLNANEAVHFYLGNNTDYYSGPRFHRCGIFKLD